MLGSRSKFYSLFGCFGLVALFMITAGHLTAFGQTDEKADNKVVKTDLVAKTETPAVPVNTKPMWRPQPSTKAPASSTGWNGFYVGGYAGVSLARATANTSTVFSSTGYFNATSVPAIATSGRQNLRPDRFTGGGTFGYNHQSGSWVVGAETDFGFLTGMKSATTTTTYPCCSPSTFTITQTLKQRWLWTARPRVGYSTGNALFYLTGGLAVTRVNYQELFTDTFATARESGGIDKTKAGWTGGGGIEYKLGSRWSVKGEYLYSDFGRSTVTSTNLTSTQVGPVYANNVFTHSIFLAQHDLRFGFNYHF